MQKSLRKKAETAIKEEQTADAEASAETADDALTPDGNMTLVDDVGSETESRKTVYARWLQSQEIISI